MPTFEKRPGAPAGPMTLTLAGGSYTFTDGGTTVVTHYQDAPYLASGGNPFIRIVGGSELASPVVVPRSDNERLLALETPYVAGSGAVERVEVYGHSYMGAPSIFTDGRNIPTRIDLAAGGTDIISYINILWGTALDRPLGQDLTDIAFVMFGINDIGRFGPVGVNFDAAMRSLISRIRMVPGSHVFHNSPQFSYTGWTTQATPSAGFWGSAGGTFTWTSPTGWAGGTVGFNCYTGIANTYGGLYTFTLNGAAAGTLDTRNWQIGPNVFRVRVPAGAGQVVSCTVSSVQTVAFLEGYQVERAAPPLVVLLKQPRTAGYTVYGAPTAPWTYVPTDASVLALNTRLDNLAAEFDAFVQPVDLDRVFDKQPGRFIADLLHPSYTGYALMASAAWTAIHMSPVVSDRPGLV